MRRVEVGNGRHLGIGIIDPLHLRHKPGIAQCSRIAHNGHVAILEWLYDIAGIEHIQHIHIHMHELPFDEVLIPAQFGGMIPTYRLVVIRSARLIEAGLYISTGSDIEYTVVHILVLQDIAIGIGHGEGIGLAGRCHEIATVEVTLVYGIHIAHENHRQGHHGHGSTHFLLTQQPQYGKAQGYNNKRAPGVGRKYCLAGLDDIGKYFGITGFPNSLPFILFQEGIKQTGNKSSQQGDTTYNGSTHIEPAFLARENRWVVKYLLQRQHSQQRHAELGHHQDTRHRAEPVVHGEIVDKPVGKPHHVLAPREHNRQNRDYQQGPFERCAHNEATQHEEEENEGSYIDRARRAGLVAPIAIELRQVRPYLGIGSLYRPLTLGETAAGTTLAVGNQEGKGLHLAIAPLGDVVFVQPFTGRFFSFIGIIGIERGQLGMASTHRFFGIFIGVVQIRGIGPNCQQSSYHQNPGRLEETGHRVRTVVLHPIGNDKGTDNKEEVVGHLYVIRHNLQGSEESGQRSAQQIFTPIGQDNTGYRRRYVGQGRKLPDVTRRNNNKEVGRKGIGYRSEGGQIPPHIEREQQNIEAQHHDKHQRHGRHQPQVIDLLQSLERGIARVGRRYLEGRHTREERTGPTRSLACLLGIGLGFVTDSQPLLGIVLKQDLTLNDIGREIDKRQYDKQQYRQQGPKVLTTFHCYESVFFLQMYKFNRNYHAPRPTI